MLDVTIKKPKTKVFVSLGLHGKTYEEVEANLAELLTKAGMSRDNVDVVNDFIWIISADYKGKKPTPGDGLAYSLLSIKDADICIFDDSYKDYNTYFGCYVEHAYIKRYLYDVFTEDNGRLIYIEGTGL